MPQFPGLSQTCDAITEFHMDEYTPFPDTTEKWLEIAKASEEKW